MNFNVFIHFIIILCLFSSCSDNRTEEKTAPETSKPLTILNWPVGKYIHETPEGITIEEWVRVDSFNIKGTNITIKKETKDTVFRMELSMNRTKDKTTMCYFIKGLSKGKGTEFTLTKDDGNLFVFENPFHDFASIMQYRVMGDTAIEITERGFMDNKEREERYLMKKIK
jgi:hypothetical protein